MMTTIRTILLAASLGLALGTGPSHAPDTASLVVGAAPGARVPPVDNPPSHHCP